MDNNILIAEQNDCNLSLAGNSEIFRYKDADGNIQSVDIKTLTDGTSLFENNQNIAVDWEVDMPNLEYATEMFAGSQLHSFDAKMPKLNNMPAFFQGCTNLAKANLTMKAGLTPTNVDKINSAFAACTNLTDVNLVFIPVGPTINSKFDDIFSGCSNLVKADILFDLPDGIMRSGNLRLVNVFKGCTRLESVAIRKNTTQGAIAVADATGMFEDCLLGPEQLQQILDWGWSPMRSTAITIGVDSTKVTQSDIDNNWNSKFINKNWNVTWQLNTPE